MRHRNDAIARTSPRNPPRTPGRSPARAS
jgi:hypothetical protein